MPTTMTAPASARLSELLQQANRHLAAAEIEPARALLDQGLVQWPNSGSLRLLDARIVEADGRADEAAIIFREAAAALREEVASLPQDPWSALALAHALSGSGEANEATTALTLARERGLDAAIALRTERFWAWKRKDWPAMQRIAKQLIAADADPTAQDLAALATACQQMNDLDGAAEAAAAALARDPAHVGAAAIAAFAAAQQGEAEIAISRYRNLAEVNPSNARWAFQIARMLILLGRVKEGSSELDAALERWPSDPSLRAFALISGFRTLEQIAPVAAAQGVMSIDVVRERQLREVIARTPSDAELLRPIVVEDKASDVLIAEAPNARTAVLVFTALTDGVSMPLPIFDRYLAASGVTAIYLKDFQRLSYFKGIASLGGDYRTTIGRLQDICHRLRATRLCTIGHSAGGAAAIRYGVELGGVCLVSFAGDTHVARGEATRLEQGLNLIKTHLAAHLSEEEMDLKNFLASRRHSSKITIVYGDEALRDKTHAAYLSGISGVTLHPVAGCGDHELLRWLAVHDDLRAMIGRLLALRGSD